MGLGYLADHQRPCRPVQSQGHASRVIGLNLGDVRALRWRAVLRLRIAHVVSTFPPYLGGAGTAASEVAGELARRGHGVEVFTARAEGTPPATAATVHRIDPLFAIGNAPLMPSLARIRGFDVLHLHHPFIFGTELLHIARLLRRMPLVVSYHNQLIGEGLRAPLFAAWERIWGAATLRAAERVCVVSHLHAQSVPNLRRVARRSPHKLVEVPNGVDLRAFAPGPGAAALRGSEGIPEDAVVAVFVSTLDRAHFLKRPDLAIDAVAAAADERLHLLVVGGGDWLMPLRQRVAAAGLADRVTFLGAVPHDRLPEVLRAADVLLVTSDRESFGIVLIEAMACGLPTVSTDPPGVRAVVQPGETGLLAPVGATAQLGAALRRIVEVGPDHRATMGKAGRVVCEQRYGWDTVVDRVEAVYAAAAGQSTSPATSAPSR
jgi:glycosyltransferase involved in cell wall biosynthesis